MRWGRCACQGAAVWSTCLLCSRIAPQTRLGTLILSFFRDRRTTSTRSLLSAAHIAPPSSLTSTTATPPSPPTPTRTHHPSRTHGPIRLLPDTTTLHYSIWQTRISSRGSNPGPHLSCCSAWAPLAPWVAPTVHPAPFLPLTAFTIPWAHGRHPPSPPLLALHTPIR